MQDEDCQKSDKENNNLKKKTKRDLHRGKGQEYIKLSPSEIT